MVLFYSSSPHSNLAVGAADSKVPMYLNRYAPCSGESFPTDDAVNKMLHHLPGQMLYMDITENTLPLLLFRRHFGFQFLQMAAGFRKQVLHAPPLRGKAIRHGTVILLADDAPYLIHIKAAETQPVIVQPLPERFLCLQPILPLPVHVLDACGAPYQLFLIQIVPGKAVQLLNDKPFQCIHGNKGAGAGISRRASAGTL